MKYLRKHWIFLGLIFVLVFSYFIIRLPGLTLQPIFADEAIYVRWSQVMKAEPTLRFLPVSDGKTPLWMWILMPVFKFVEDPLLAGRLLSVVLGVWTLLGVLFLGWKYFDKKTAVWAGFLNVVTPYIVFFDRMALVDSFLAAFSLWSLIFTLLLVEYKRLDLAMILGGILGGGWLTKTPGLFSVLSLPLGLINFNWKNRGKYGLLQILGLIGVSMIIAVAFYNLLRLGPGFDSLSSRNGDYIHSPLHLLESPLDPFIPHFRDLIDWLPKMLTLPILLVVLGGIVWPFIKRNRVAMAILAWSIFPLLVEMALLKTFTTRYILFTISPLLFLAGWFISQTLPMIKKNHQFAVVAIFLIILLPAMWFNRKLWFAPETANLPHESRRGYFEDWTAGTGLEDIANYLKAEAKVKKIVVGTGGAFGTLPDGLYIYLDKVPNISIVPGKATISGELRNAALNNETFFVVSKSQYGQKDSGLELIKEYPKAVGYEIPQDFMLLYRVLPK